MLIFDVNWVPAARLSRRHQSEIPPPLERDLNYSTQDLKGGRNVRGKTLLDAFRPTRRLR